MIISTYNRISGDSFYFWKFTVILFLLNVNSTYDSGNCNYGLNLPTLATIEISTFIGADTYVFFAN